MDCRHQRSWDTAGRPERVRNDDEGITYNEKIVSHVIDVGANYWSCGTGTTKRPANISSYYDKYPEPIDSYRAHIGYRVHPSFIWRFERDGTPGLVIGLVNNGIAGVPGVLRLTAFSDDRKVVRVGGCVDPGYPKPGGVRQAMLPLPAGNRGKGPEAEG